MRIRTGNLHFLHVTQAQTALELNLGALKIGRNGWNESRGGHGAAPGLGELGVHSQVKF